MSVIDLHVRKMIVIGYKHLGLCVVSALFFKKRITSNRNMCICCNTKEENTFNRQTNMEDAVIPGELKMFIQW